MRHVRTDGGPLVSCTLRRRSLQTSLSTAMKQTAPSCLQVEQPSGEQQAAEGAVLAHKSAGPGTAHAAASSRAGLAESLQAKRQAARLEAEQELAALQALLQELESTRQQEAVALHGNLPLQAAALQASRSQLQEQVALHRLRHQEARFAELCIQQRLTLAEGPINRQQALAGEQPHFTPIGHYSKQAPRFGTAAREAWQELPVGFPGHPYIAHRVKLLTQGPSNPSRPGRQSRSLPKSRFWPRPAAAERPQPAGSVAPGRPASAGGSQVPLPATLRLPARSPTTSGQPSRVIRADVQQQSIVAANSPLQCKDQARAAVSPQVRIATTSATDHTGCCQPPCEGCPLTVLATCSRAAKASEDRRACPGT